MGWKERAGALKEFAWKNVDALLVIGVAAGVLIAEVVGSPSRELVDSAILALLGVTAFILLRDREKQKEFAEIRQLAIDAQSDRPFEVVWQQNHWDIKDRSHSTVTVTQRLRFIRNDVSTLTNWSTGDGRVERCEAKWRRSEETPWIGAETIHEFGIRNGKKVIFCLNEEYRRGEMLDWCVERDGVDRFPSSREGVSLKARTRSDHPRVLRVTWPPGQAPTHIELRMNGRAARTLPAKQDGERVFVEEKVANLPIGEEVEIAWNW